MANAYKWGFLRETQKQVEKAAKIAEKAQKEVCYTCFDEYRKVIFPELSEDEWKHNKRFYDKGKRTFVCADFCCEKLKLVIEIDGVQHYTNPDVIVRDIEKDQKYKNLGYRIVRIPYFIQLTNETIRILFDRDVDVPMFDKESPSFVFWKNCHNTPAYMCPAGIERMRQDFQKFPQQYQVNLCYLKELDKQYHELAGLKYLEANMNN